MNESPKQPVSIEPKGNSKHIWVLAWTGVGLFAAGCLLVGIWHVRSRHASQVEAANLRVSRATTAAIEWMAGDDLSKATAVELSLIEVLADKNVSYPTEGHAVLQRVRQHREALEEQKRVAAAEKDASQIYADARQLIKRRNSRDASIVLKEYLAHAHAKNKAEAQMILEELSIASSDSKVLSILVDMDGKSFASVEKSGTLTDHRVTRAELKVILNETVMRNLPAARQKREAIEAEKKRLAEERARKELLRRQMEEKRLADERERRRQIAGGLAALANNPTDLEKFLYAGEFTNGIVEFQTELLAKPQNDNIRFQLALVQFFRSVERLGQSLHRYGVKQSVDDIPFLRLPVPANPDPAQISYADCRQILDDLVKDLDNVDSTLAGITSNDVAVSLRLGVIRFDMDGDGNADQELNAILKQLHQKEFAFLKGNEALPVDFDRGDAVWLRIYCQLMSAVLDFVLAFDLEPAFDIGGSAKHLFANPQVGKKRWDGEFVYRIAEPRRLSRLRRRLILITELNHEMWKHVRAEKDNSLEWVPNSKQQSILGFTVNDQLVGSWLVAMTEVEAALKGERVIPRVFFQRNGRGFNLKNLLEDPPESIDQPLIDGLPDSLPDKYFTDGVDFNVGTLYTLFQNYHNWFSDGQNF
jgi:flagellar basal body-associated protein FliL